ncbi:hypothetical protein QAD02_018218 [Eretmocerus hayati]|uniref:Uncharacterized protein n=1 Tax=Eretmocerus hayati TaxID=131215 RepID=A0ACC2PHC2_9HYME|nr:hypothetical protein QAD02_018218 [Eretmocerus hayati]
MSCSVKVQPTTGATKNPTSWSSQRTTSRLALESHQESCLTNNTLAPAGISGNVNVSSNKIQPQQQQQSPPPRVPRSGCSASSTTTATSANAAAAARKAEDTLKLLRYIDDNLIGRNGTFLGPFGRRKGEFSVNY